MLGGIAVLVLLWDKLLNLLRVWWSSFVWRLLWTSTSSGFVVARDASIPLYHNLGISFAVWCPCDRARCLVRSLRLGLLSDSGMQQLDDHIEVLEDIILSIMFLSNVVCFTRGFSSMQLDQNKSVGHPALFEGKDRMKDDHVRVLVDASMKHLCCRQLQESSG